jgi:hypothetical protein
MNTFKDCISLTEVILMKPSGVTALASTSAFSGCTALESIWVPADLVQSYKDATNWKNDSLVTKIKDGADRTPAVEY